MNNLQEIKELKRIAGVKIHMLEFVLTNGPEHMVGEYEKEITAIAGKLKVFDEDMYTIMIGAVDAAKDKYKK